LELNYRLGAHQRS